MSKLSKLFCLLLLTGSLLLGVAVFSYNADDPSFSNVVVSRVDEPIHNMLGMHGAFVADFVGIIFGFSAILLPFFLLYIAFQYIYVKLGKLSKLMATFSISAFIALICVLSIQNAFLSTADAYFTDKPAGGLIGLFINVGLVSPVAKTLAIIFIYIFSLACVLVIMRISPMSIAHTFRQLADRLNGAGEDEEDGQDERSEPEVLKDILPALEQPLAVSQPAQHQPTLPQLNAVLEPAVEYDDPLIRPVELPQVVPGYLSEAETSVSMQQESETTDNISLDGAMTVSELEDMMGEDATPLGMTVAEIEKVMALTEMPETPVGTPTEQLIPIEPAQPISPLHSVEPTQPQSVQLTETEQSAEPASIEQVAPTSWSVERLDEQQEPEPMLYQPIENYHLDINALDRPEMIDITPDMDALKRKGDALLTKLRSFGVEGQIRNILPGPVVTLFEFEPAPGIKISKIASLENDLALAMSAESIRIIAPIPGQGVVGIEAPNEYRASVRLRELIDTPNFYENESPLAVALGKDISGNPYYADLRSMPHILVAGTTGSGKSVCINTMLCSILYKSAPDKVKFILIDPKMVELNVYSGIPHLAAPVVTDMREAANVLNNVVKEMEARYKLFLDLNVRDIVSYNKNKLAEQPPLPYMVVIADEFGDLMMVAGKEVESAIIRLAQKARAAGIHLILATQRPSVNVITGIIKANMPTRLSFRVSSKVDSRIILDQSGAELLLGKGDSLFIPPSSGWTIRVHGSFISEDEVKRVVDEAKRYGEPEYNMELLESEEQDSDFASGDALDPLFDRAVLIGREEGTVSISRIQRKLGIGYNRAANIVEMMEQQGLIEPSSGSPKPRRML
ncbi:hypothetical protein RsTz2092_13210 [Deferribacterales bacterium RsTz2092]|nr:hypothetical protein AGMMS49941_12320 [Deferribacterales bacterium]